MAGKKSIQESIHDISDTIGDEIASKAVRKSTLKSLKVKKASRLKQLKADYEKSVQEINIQYAKDPERLKAKYAAAQYARTEKAKKRAEKRIARAQELIAIEEKTRRLTIPEEIASSIVQGIGVGLFIAATAILDTIAIARTMEYVSVTTVFYSLFGAAMILMYLFSLLHHAIPNITAKGVFDRLSHIWAFLSIGFGYTAYLVTKIQGVAGWVLFGVVWGLVTIGILFYAIAGKKYQRVNFVLYVLAGFSGLVVAKPLFDVLSRVSFSMLILAAVFYIIGIIFYNLRKVKYMHLVGNIMMLAGSVYMFFSLFFIN